MHSQNSWWAALGILLFSLTMQAGETLAADAAATESTVTATSPMVSEMLLTGIAAIGETRFIYLTHVSGSLSLELKAGPQATAHPGGIEILRVHDEGPTASWRVLVRSQGKVYWLSFAPASLVPSGSGLATGIPADAATAAARAVQSPAPGNAATPAAEPRPPAFKAPPSNPGTFSNDPSKDTPTQARQRRNNFPLPPGL